MTQAYSEKEIRVLLIGVEPKTFLIKPNIRNEELFHELADAEPVGLLCTL